MVNMARVATFPLLNDSILCKPKQVISLLNFPPVLDSFPGNKIKAVKNINKTKSIVFSIVSKIISSVSSCPPLTMGITVATRIRDATSSSTAEVIIPVAALVWCSFSCLRATIVRDTAVAVMVSPTRMAIFWSCHKYNAMK